LSKRQECKHCTHIVEDEIDDIGNPARVLRLFVPKGFVCSGNPSLLGMQVGLGDPVRQVCMKKIVETYIQNQIEVIAIEVSSTKAGC